MKRKLLNAALFGAVLVAAPVSTFVSCADYDSDINVLNKQIDDLNGLVAQKEAAIQQKIDELKAQESALEKADQELSKKLDQCKEDCTKKQAELAQKQDDLSQKQDDFAKKQDDFAKKQAELEQNLLNCKAECAAAQANLQASIDALQAALDAAKELEGKHYAELLEADKILTKGLADANARIDDIINNRIPALETSLKGYVDNELQQVYQSMETMQQTLSAVYNQLTDLETLLTGKIAEVAASVAALQTKLEGDIAKNAADIVAANNALEAHKAAFETYKTGAAAELEAVKAALESKGNTTAAAVAALETVVGSKASQTDLNNLAAVVTANGGDITALQEALNALGAKVTEDIAKNTKGVVDNAARIVYLESKINENALQISALATALEAAQAAQAQVDAAQDLAVENLKLNLANNYYDKTTTDGKLEALNTALNTLIQTKYNDAVAHADALLVQANTYTDNAVAALHTQIGVDFRAWVEQSLNPALGQLADGQVTLQNNIDAVDAKFAGYYTKGAIDAFVAALEAADAQRDADFRAWVEQVLNPGLAALNTAIDQNAQDIAANAAKIAANEVAIAANNAAIVANEAAFRAWIEQVLNPGLAGLQSEISANAASIAQNAADIVANRQAIEANAADFRAWIEQDLNPAMAELTSKIDQNIADIATNRANLEQEVQDRITALNSLHATIGGEFRTWIEQDLNPCLETITDDIDGLTTRVGSLEDLSVELSKEVKGFVLEPASYYEGIQAIEGTSYEFHVWNVTDAKNPVQTTGAAVKYCPEVTAHYHVNPSAAVLSKDVANYSFAVLDRQNRGVNNDLKPVVTKVAQNDGMLDVTLRLTDANANKTPQEPLHNSLVTVMALQYKNPAAKAADQVVTSDYAVLYLNPLKEVSLVGATNTDHEIGASYEFADKDYVQYTETYDITAQLKTSFGGENAVSISDKEKWPAGFTYRYTIMEGTENAYFATSTDEEGNFIVKPQLPNGKPATTACVGKSATWRIDVMHGNDVVEVGFYKLTITGEAVVETAPAVVTEDILKVTCEPTDEALNVDLSLDNVWNKIGEVIGEEDIEKVKAAYSVTTADGKVVQFKEYESEAERVLYKQYEGKGVITLVDGKAHWVVLDNDPYVESDLRSATKDMKSMTTYIRVRSNDAISKDTYNEFYMPLVWTPKPIEFWGESQEISWTYTRVANQWQTSTNNAEEKEIRLYADLTKAGTTPFTYDIPEKAMVDFDFTKLQFVGTAFDFVNVKNGNIGVTDGHFRFINHPVEAARKTTVGGVEYVFTVSADGKNFLANNVVIATITETGLVNLENNATSQLLLNAFGKEQLAYGQTLCARVGFEAKCCAGEVKVINGDFDVRFIKPLTINNTEINISDADDILESGKVVTSILDNIVAFNNNTLADHTNYIETFGVGIEFGDVAEWKTNYNADADDFSKTLADNKIDNLFDKNEAKGEIFYFNNTAVVSEFSVIVPVKVHYNWNTTPVSVDVKINVARTRGNSNRR